MRCGSILAAALVQIAASATAGPIVGHIARALVLVERHRHGCFTVVFW